MSASARPSLAGSLLHSCSRCSSSAISLSKMSAPVSCRRWMRAASFSITKREPGTSLAETDRLLRAGRADSAGDAGSANLFAAHRPAARRRHYGSEHGRLFRSAKTAAASRDREVMDDVRAAVEHNIPGLADRNRAVNGRPDRRPHFRAAADRDQALFRRRRDAANRPPPKCSTRSRK